MAANDWTLERLKMWGEVTHAQYGKINIGTVRGGKGRIWRR